MDASVLLPLPFGPMMAWTSPGLMVRLTPFRICFPSTPAWRFLISSMDRFFMSIQQIENGSADAAFEAYAEQLLRFDGELHRQLAEDFLAKAVHNHVDGVLRRNAALVAVKNLVFANLRG